MRVTEDLVCGGQIILLNRKCSANMEINKIENIQFSLLIENCAYYNCYKNIILLGFEHSNTWKRYFLIDWP